MTNEALLKRKDLARILQVSEATIKRWEVEGLPVMTINHQTKYYDFVAVKEWMKTKEENNHA